MSVEVKCQLCSKVLVKQQKKFCSSKCANKPQKPKQKVKCQQCSKEFSVIHSRAKTAKYCGHRCLGKNKTQYQTVLLQCKACLKEFRVSRSIAEHTKYCNQECNTKSMITSVTLQCNTCEREYLRVPSRASQSKYCSKKCMPPNRCYDGEYFTATATRDVPGTLYLIKFNDAKPFYKVGITTQKLKQRWAGHNYNVLLTVSTTIYKAWLVEQKIIAQFTDYAYVPELLQGHGSTECFSTNLPVPQVIDIITETPTI